MLVQGSSARWMGRIVIFIASFLFFSATELREMYSARGQTETIGELGFLICA
jgi:hypothetical protein